MVKKEDGSICYKTLASRSYIVLDPNTQMLMPWAKKHVGYVDENEDFQKEIPD
jgi:hypothetical protein